MVGWKGSWCSRSWEELEDWKREKRKGAKRVEEEEEADGEGERIKMMEEGGGMADEKGK